MFMEEQDRLGIFDLLSPRKASRIQEELLLHDRLRINYNQYQSAVDQVIRKLTHDYVKPGARGYLRPVK